MTHQNGRTLREADLPVVHSIQKGILDEVVRICQNNGLQYFLIGGTLLGAVRHGGFIPWDDDLDIVMPRDDYDRFLALCKDELDSRYVLDYYGTNPKYWLPYAKVRRKDTIYELESQVGLEGVPKGVWIDIFPLDNMVSSRLVQIVQGFVFRELRFYIRARQLNQKSNLRWRRILHMLYPPLSVERLFGIMHRVMTLWNKKECKYYVNFGSQYGVKKQTIEKERYFPPRELLFENDIYQVPNDYDYILQRIFGNYHELPPLEKRVGHRPVRVDLDCEEIAMETERL